MHLIYLYFGALLCFGLNVYVERSSYFDLPASVQKGNIKKLQYLSMVISNSHESIFYFIFDFLNPKDMKERLRHHPFLFGKISMCIF